MRNLVVLCAGSRTVNGHPLFLLRHPDGKLIAEKVIEGIFPESYDRIVYVVLEETDQAFGAAARILNSVGRNYPVEVLQLPEKTGGPAETAYYAVKKVEIKGQLSIRDSHSYIALSEKMTGNCVAGLDLMKYEKTIDNLRSKSFIVLNEQKQILDVVEKRFCSDVISGGLYGFKQAADFVMAYEKLSNPDYPIQELYVSHIISYLIGYSRRVFHCASISEFEDWATPDSWMRIQKKYATYFLELETVCGMNIPYEEDTIEVLRQASRNGCRFIAYTSERSIDVSRLMAYMRDEKINILQIVTGCTASKVKAIINTRELLGETILEG
ncbi:MAG: hypothetical protein HFG69_06455 [Hungatella sp.]|nr:hypothetical protein [Hungatella sp.]